jgi:hypothetical protein
VSATVVSVNEVIGTGGDVSLKATEFTRVFLVKLSAPSSVGQDMALHASGIPAMTAAWPNTVTGRSTPTVRSKNAKLHSASSRLLWVVEVKYSNERESAESQQADIAPWLQPPQYSSEPIDYSIAYDTARNSVGDAFDPVPEIPHSNRRLTIKRNSLFFSEANAIALQNTTNESPFSIRGQQYEAKKLRLLRWAANTAVWTNDAGASQSYYEETIEIEHSTFPHGHMLKILNQGYRARPTSTDDPIRVTDEFPAETGQPVPQPVLLAEDGTKLAAEGTPVFLEFEPLVHADWSALGVL